MTTAPSPSPISPPAHTPAAALAAGGHVTGLDQVRGVAVGAVLVYHFFPSFLPAGYLGVDLFFLLSGVLIAAQLGVRQAPVLPWLWRRLVRIWPALLMACAGTLALGVVVLLPEDLSRLAAGLGAGALFAGNLHHDSIAGYFVAPGNLDASLHLWSLGVEMQIYAGAAALFAVAGRHVPAWGLLGLVFFASLAWMGYALATEEGMDPFYDPRARAWQAALGGLVLLGALQFGRMDPSGRVGALVLGPLALVAGSAGAAWAAFTLHPVDHPGAGTLLFTGGAGLALLALLVRPLPRPALPGLGLAGRALTGLGRISYGVYLWHWPLLILAAHHDTGPLTPAEKSLLVCLSLGLGALSHGCLEAPLRRRWQAVWPLAWGGAAVLLALLGVVLAVLASRGLPQRLPEQVRDILAVAPAHDLVETCHIIEDPFPVARACRHNWPEDADTLPPVAVLGDSHAMTLAGGLARAGLSFVEYTYSGCTPARGLTQAALGSACARRTEAAVRAILDSDAVTTVIVASRWAFYTAPRFDNGRGGRDRLAAPVMRDVETGAHVDAATVRDRQIATIERLADGGKQVLVVGPTPVFGWDVRRHAARQVWSGGADTPGGLAEAIVVPRATMESRQGPIRDRLRAVAQASPSVFFLDPTDLFCDDALCRAIDETGTPLFHDQDHLSTDGADMLASDVVSDVNELSSCNGPPGGPRNEGSSSYQKPASCAR